MTARAETFPQMFNPGYGVTVHEIGILQLPSGYIVSGDPVGAFEFEPFARRAPVGAFPVQASVLAVSPEESRIAAVRIVFSQQPIARWEVATGGTGAEDHGGYKGPLGMFLDRDTVPGLEAYIEENGPEWFLAPPRMQGPRWEHACFHPDRGRDGTCVLFQAGRGDGVFTSYWAFGANDAPSMLVTDFNVTP